MSDMYKKLGVNKHKAKPGDLMMAAKGLEASKADKAKDKKMGLKEGGKKDMAMDLGMMHKAKPHHLMKKMANHMEKMASHMHKAAKHMHKHMAMHKGHSMHKGKKA